MKHLFLVRNDFYSEWILSFVSTECVQMVVIIANYGEVIGDLQNKWRRIEDQYNVLENWLEKGLYFSRENAHYILDKIIWLRFWQWVWNILLLFFLMVKCNKMTLIKQYIIWLCILAGTIDSWLTNHICPLAEEKYTFMLCSSILLTNLWLKLPKSDHFRPRNFGLLIEFPAWGTQWSEISRILLSADVNLKASL